MKRILRQHGYKDDSGVTLIEVIFAIGLFAVILTAFALLMYTSQNTIREGRERQAANAVGIEALERVRALPLDTIRLGLSNAEVAASADPAISGSAGNYTVTDADGVTYKLLTSNYTVSTDPTQQNPFAPHIQTITATPPANTIYTVRTYPILCYMNKSTQTCNTAKTDPADVEMIKVITLVSYTEAIGGNTVTRQFTTSLFNAEGCQLNGQQTFVGPCEPFFNATATVTGAAIGVEPSNRFSTQQPFGFTKLAFAAGSDTAAVKQEQVLTVVANGTTGSASGEGITGSSPVGAFAQSSTDPAKGDAIAQQSTFSQSVQPTGSVGGVIDGTGEATSSGTVATALRAQATDNCLNAGGTLQVTQQPCASASHTTSGMQITLDLGDGDIVELVTVGAAGTPSRVHAARASNTATGVCTSPSGDGCIESSARRAYGSVTLLQFPEDMADAINDSLPTGESFDSTNGAYLKTSPVATNTVSGWAGFNGTASPIPDATTVSMTGTYFDGNNIVNGTWNQGASIALGDIDTVFDYKGDTYVLKVSGNVSRGAVTREYPASGADCAAAACSTRAVIESPVSGNYDFFMTKNGEVVANFRVTVDLGTTQALATYQAAQ